MREGVVESMIDEIVREAELVILLNMLDDPVEITYPTTNAQLFKCQRSSEGYSLSLTCSRNSLETASNPSSQPSEMPLYRDIVECLISGDVIRFSNLEELKESINSQRGFGKQLHFSPDTNILYHRFFSNSGLVDTRDIILVDTIRNEIESSLNHKYKPEEITVMKSTTQYNRQLIDELVNRRTKKSRKAAYLAKTEYQFVRQHATEIESCDKSTENKEENDRVIAKTLGKFSKETNASVIMLSGDDSMIDLCEMEGLKYFHLKVPNEIDSNIGNVTAKQMRALLFNLAGVLGFIKVNSVIAFGEFKGKKDLKDLKLRFMDENAYNEFSRDLKTCRRLLELGIAQ